MIVRLVFEQVSEPPLTVGAVGAVRSSLTVLVAPFELGVHAEALPTAVNGAELHVGGALGG